MSGMKLDVLETRTEPWYAEGLKFTCTQCGNCCTGGPGYVWISNIEIERLAQFLHLSPQETVERYCRKVDGKFTLKERRMPDGNYDCIFLREQEGHAAGKQLDAGEGVPLRRKICSIYAVRPLQCRTWPFWAENLADPKIWERSAKRCHGMNRGARVFGREEIEALRDAGDWPDNPPTSGVRADNR